MTDEPEIRFLGDVQRLVLGPTDIVVLRCPAHVRLSAEAAERLRSHMRESLGTEHKVVVLSDGLEIGILSPSPKQEYFTTEKALSEKEIAQYREWWALQMSKASRSHAPPAPPDTHGIIRQGF